MTQRTVILDRALGWDLAIYSTMTWKKLISLFADISNGPPLAV